MRSIALPPIVTSKCHPHLGNGDVNLPHPEVEVTRRDEAIVSAVQPLHAEGRVLGSGGAAHGPACLHLPDDYRVVVLSTEGRKVFPVKAVAAQQAKSKNAGGWRGGVERHVMKLITRHMRLEWYARLLQKKSHFSAIGLCRGTPRKPQ